MRKSLLILIAIIFIAIGCAEKPAAVVNGSKISKKELEFRIKEKVQEHNAQGAKVASEAMRASVIDQVVSERLLAQGAKEKGIAVTEDEVKNRIEAVKKAMGEGKLAASMKESGINAEDYKAITRDRLLSDKFAASLVTADSIAPDDVKDYYTKSPTPFLMPESVHIRFIEIATEDEAKAVMGELKARKDFDGVADRLNAEKKATVSIYGWTSPEFFGPQISKGLKAIETGKFGGPFKGKESFFIIRVKERQGQRAKTIEEATPEIKSMLLDQKKTTEIIHWLAKKKKASSISINTK